MRPCPSSSSPFHEACRHRRGDNEVPVPAGNLLGDAGELAGRADAAGMPHPRVGLVGLDVAGAPSSPTARATAVVTVAVAVGGGNAPSSGLRLVVGGGGSRAACGGTRARAVARVGI